MSDQKYDLILSQMKVLTDIVKAIRRDQEVQGAILQALSDTLHTFRSATDVNFKKLDRRVKLIETDLDETMVRVSEISIPK